MGFVTATKDFHHAEFARSLEGLKRAPQQRLAEFFEEVASIEYFKPKVPPQGNWVLSFTSPGSVDVLSAAVNSAVSIDLDARQGGWRHDFNPEMNFKSFQSLEAWNAVCQVESTMRQWEQIDKMANVFFNLTVDRNIVTKPQMKIELAWQNVLIAKALAMEEYAILASGLPLATTRKMRQVLSLGYGFTGELDHKIYVYSNNRSEEELLAELQMARRLPL